MKTPAQIASECVKRIVDDLSDRRGLGQEWSDIDDEIREEIEGTWREIIADEIKAGKI